jgi:hypothetical protein
MSVDHPSYSSAVYSMFVLIVLGCFTLAILVQFVSDTALVFRRYVHGHAHATPDSKDDVCQGDTCMPQYHVPSPH